MRKTLFAMGALMLLLSSCRSRDLTRDEAKRLIEASEQFSPAQPLNFGNATWKQVTGCEWPPVEVGTSEGKYPRELSKVTGVTSAEASSARAEFVWDWKDASPMREKCFGGAFPKKGAARFQRYDDGWRLMDLETSEEMDMDEVKALSKAGR